MDSPNSFTFKPFLHQYIFVFIIIFFTLAHQTVSDYSEFEACEPKTCGSNLTIRFPFWISGEQESYCGSPNFGITCNDQKPVLNISYEDYIIKDIFYENSSLRLANFAAYENSSPTPFYNLTLTRTPFNFVPSDTDLFFWYNCSDKPPEDGTYSISCGNEYSHYYSFAAFQKEMLVNYSLESCQSSVYAPLNVETGANLWQMNYTEILKIGFVLNWTALSCSNCEASGGRCGFDNSEFVCFCKDKTYQKTCDYGSTLNLGRKLAIGNTDLSIVLLLQ
ncbi:hypothetical protein Pint_16515 [Pistacia integerrima]|uniref:Uncharacterized protein n=1 Tax=Pistacia integerrima TaxID=434235 RepID=A0ACC0Z9K7_9ROSI|nr:hypothetical protein Pint_16515 [Pistacia integerrima]